MTTGMLMSWSAIAENYGLRKPYNFRIVIPLLLNLIASIFVFLACVSLIASKSLIVGTERFYFFLYLATLLLIGTAFSRAPRISLAIFLWSAAELSAAVVSSELKSLGAAASLFPRNMFTATPDPRFEYHPVLGLVPKASSHGEWHFDRRNAPLVEHTWPINPSFFADNFFSHNSLGLRGRELSESDMKKELIFVYGGSTTYDYTVTQGETWPERMEANLEHRFTVVNFGVIVHSTTQHLIYTAFHQNVLHKTPICAVYYVGWNDLSNSHTPNLDPTYANHLSLAMNSFVPKRELWAAKYSPLFHLIDRAARRRFEPEFFSLNLPRWGAPAIQSDVRLESFFVEHVGAIAAINAARGIKTVFIGQLFNRDLLQRRPYDRYAAFEFKDVWPMQERLNSILERTSISLGAKYIDAGIGNFNNDDFSDLGHFSSAGSRKFADLVSKRVESHCQ